MPLVSAKAGRSLEFKGSQVYRKSFRTAGRHRETLSQKRREERRERERERERERKERWKEGRKEERKEEPRKNVGKQGNAESVTETISILAGSCDLTFPVNWTGSGTTRETHLWVCS